jgi:addiction module RelB/DinJ family antitoxin
LTNIVVCGIFVVVLTTGVVIMSTTVVQARMSTDLKNEAERVLMGLELDLPQAIRLFFRQIVNRETLPFGLVQKKNEDPFWSEENQEWLKKAIAQADRGEFVVKTMAELEEMAK